MQIRWLGGSGQTIFPAFAFTPHLSGTLHGLIWALHGHRPVLQHCR